MKGKEAKKSFATQLSELKEAGMTPDQLAKLPEQARNLMTAAKERGKEKGKAKRRGKGKKKTFP